VICVQGSLSKPLHMEDIDSSSGLLIPFFDADTNVIYVAGKVLHRASNIVTAVRGASVGTVDEGVVLAVEC